MNSSLRQKPELNFWQIWNMCFGFLGIQFGFALQNSNVSRIFQTLGADMQAIPILFIAAPLTGLIVQPLIGHFSDKTWNRMGRRRPYFFWGAVLTTASLVFMPNSPTLWVAAIMLWVMDASINVTMEPFRAFVGDMLPSRQRTYGYVMQTFFIGIGAVIASMLPWIFTSFLEVSNVAAEGVLPDSVRYSFYLGASAVAIAVGWTIFRTQEYSPQQLAQFEEPENASFATAEQAIMDGKSIFSSIAASSWSALGLATTVIIYIGNWDYQLYILSGGVTVFGLLQFYAVLIEKSENKNGFYDACRSVALMPSVMRRVGVLFGAYNGFSIFAALLIPIVARRIGLKGTHSINLLIGAAGLASIMIIKDPDLLLISMIGVGFAWASILSVPYAILSDSVPSQKMGIYMGVFNFFIVIPQLVAASLLGLALKYLFAGETIYILALAASFWVLAAISVALVKYDAAT